eukprot:3401462-Amphidinium_carterae.1
MHAKGFLITGSADGHIKFWKKQPEGAWLRVSLQRCTPYEKADRCKTTPESFKVVSGLAHSGTTHHLARSAFPHELQGLRRDSRMRDCWLDTFLQSCPCHFRKYVRAVTQLPFHAGLLFVCLLTHSCMRARAHIGALLGMVLSQARQSSLL